MFLSINFDDDCAKVDESTGNLLFLSYRVSYIEMSVFKWFWGVEGSKNHRILSSILVAFRLEAVEDSLCHLCKNWLMKLKCPLLLNMHLKKNQQNYWSFYPSEPFENGHFNVRHPVSPWNTDEVTLLWISSKDQSKSNLKHFNIATFLPK